MTKVKSDERIEELNYKIVAKENEIVDGEDKFNKSL